VLLESLDDLQRSRSQFVQRAKRLATADDIQPRLVKAAARFERWVVVQPAMFQDVSDAELAKYDKFIQAIAEGAQKQEEVLGNILVCIFFHNNRPAT
jgi:programmed cell death 6-interacting protein